VEDAFGMRSRRGPSGPLKGSSEPEPRTQAKGATVNAQREGKGRCAFAHQKKLRLREAQTDDDGSPPAVPG
jgi:hypothetical protein